MADDNNVDYVVAKRYQEELPRIKKNVENAFTFWEENYKSYWFWTNFVFQSTLDDNWLNYLQRTGKPKVEFNIVAPFVNRQCGEFSKNEPSVSVSSEKKDPLNPVVDELIEGYLRHEFTEAQKNGTQRITFLNMIAKGFGVMKVWLDYKNNDTFDQDIKWDNVYDPTLCFHDPAAKKRHKTDGKFGGEVIPYTKEEFEEQFPDVDISQIKFSGTLGKFNWSYKDENKKMILVCDYYEKKRKRVKKYLLANDEVVSATRYKEIENEINTYGLPKVVPEIKDERYVMEETVCLYRFIENQVIEYKETIYPTIPYIWFTGVGERFRDGNSTSGQIKELCFPLIYHAIGAQKMKNYAGQTLLHAIETLPQQKWKIPVEGIPQGCEDMYKDNSVPSNILYHCYKPDQPDKPLPSPEIVQGQMINQEISNAFLIADKTVQMSLGTYDSALGINDNQLSGTAIEAGAMNSNASVAPYITSYMESLNEVANSMVGLIPKVWKTPRSVPFKSKDGKVGFIPVNQPSAPSLDYDTNVLNIKVEAGVSFEAQKSKSLKAMADLGRAFPGFAMFAQQMPEFLRIIVENLDIAGKDRLTDLADKFIAQQRQMIEAAKNKPPQPNPEMMKAQVQMADVQRKMKQDDTNARLEAARISVSDKEADNTRIKALSDMQLKASSQELQAMKAHAEEARANADMAIKYIDIGHGHRHDNMEAHRKMVDTVLTHANASSAQQSQPNNNFNEDNY